MLSKLETQKNGLTPITEMGPEQIKNLPSSIFFRSPEVPPDHVRARLDNLTFDREYDDNIFWHRMVSIPAPLLGAEAHIPDLKVYIAQQVNKNGEMVAVHFVEDSGELSGFAQVLFGNGTNGRKKEEPYVMWTHTDKGLGAHGRGLLRTIIMGEYAKRELKKSLDAGDMIPSTNESKRKIVKDYSHFIHIWQTLEHAGLAGKTSENHYQYLKDMS